MKWTMGIVVALVALVLLAWLALPSIVQSQLQTRGSAMLGREVRVQKVEFSPWALSVTLHGLSVAAAASDVSAPPQLEVSRIHVDADARSILRLAPVIEAIEIDAPKLRVARLPGERWDFDDVLARLDAMPAEPASEGDEPARFAVFNVQLHDGELQFDDRPVQRRHSVGALQLAVPFVSNLPDDIAVHVEPRLTFVFDGSPVDLRGRTLPFSTDRATEMALDVKDLDLSRFWAYLPPKLPLRPKGGRFAAALTVQFAQPPGQPARMVLRGKSSLRGLALDNTAGAPMLGLGELEVDLAEVRPFERKVALGAVTLSGLQADVRRDAGGGLEWQRLADGAGTTGGPASAAASKPGYAPVPTTAAAAPGSAASVQGSASAPAGQGAASMPRTAQAKARGWQVTTGRVQLRGTQVRWSDAAVRPAVELATEPFDASIGSVSWPTAGEVPVEAQARLMAGKSAVAQFELAGKVSDRRADLKVTLDKVVLGAAAPYLRDALRPAIEGRARLQATLEWAAGSAGDPARSVVTADTLQVDGLRVTEPGQRQPALQVASLTVQGARADMLAHRMSVGSVGVRQPVVRLQRGTDGRLNVQAWATATASTAPAAPTVPSAKSSNRPTDWQAEIGPMRVDGGSVDWRDAAVSAQAPLAMRIDGLRIGLDRFDWPLRNKAARMDLAAQVRLPRVQGEPAEPPGRLQARGAVTLDPPAWRGSVNAERLPAHAFEPYFGAELPVQLRRAEVGLRGDLDLKVRPQGLSLVARGDVLLADVQVNERDSAQRNGGELIGWQSLSMKPVHVAVAPGARPLVEIDKLIWSDFYSRLVITEAGRFNLRDVAAAPGDGAPAAAASAPARPVAADVPSSKTTVAASVAASGAQSGAASTLPVDLVVGATQLVNGKVDFTDRFIRPNYSAALTELNGTLGRLDSRTRDMATLELRGRAAGTALLEIRGAVNPTADPLALDISARATDLELAPLSPYAGKYAGYAIERGKLSMDVAYRIDPDGKLEAKNQVILNQLTFGDKIDSPDATKLPVRLAVALLTDRNGVIDINLPVTGSINDPQFSVFGIVLKLIGNLLLKALTAPFSLLAGGATEDLSLVQFMPGTTTIAASSLPVIERVAKSLADRPALRMTVTGAADPVSEREAIRSATLDAMIAAAQRRELARAGAAQAASAPLPKLDAPGRAQIVKRLYADTKLPNKPRNLIGLAKDIPPAEMEALLKGATVVSTDTARELALQRGLAVRDALIAKGLGSDRLFLGAPKIHAAGEGDAAWTPRVQLSLATP